MPQAADGPAAGDDGAVRALFRATLALGRPLPFAVPDLDAYERLSLDWFLGPGRGAAAVLEAEGEVVGYTLVALDHDAYHRWAVPRAVAWGARAVAGLAAGLAKTFTTRQAAAIYQRSAGHLPKPMRQDIEDELASGGANTDEISGHSRKRS